LAKKSPYDIKGFEIREKMTYSQTGSEVSLIKKIPHLERNLGFPIQDDNFFSVQPQR